MISMLEGALVMNSTTSDSVSISALIASINLVKYNHCRTFRSGQVWHCGQKYPWKFLPPEPFPFRSSEMWTWGRRGRAWESHSRCGWEHGVHPKIPFLKIAQTAPWGYCLRPDGNSYSGCGFALTVTKIQMFHCLSFLFIKLHNWQNGIPYIQ